VNRIKTFFTKVADPHVNSLMQIANTGLVLCAIFMMFVLIEIFIFSSQLVQLSPLENKIKEFKENTNSLPESSLKVKKKLLTLKFKKLI
jgi:hypothetical protein